MLLHKLFTLVFRLGGMEAEVACVSCGFGLGASTTPEMTCRLADATKVQVANKNNIRFEAFGVQRILLWICWVERLRYRRCG